MKRKKSESQEVKIIFNPKEDITHQIIHISNCPVDVNIKYIRQEKEFINISFSYDGKSYSATIKNLEDKYSIKDEIIFSGIEIHNIDKENIYKKIKVILDNYS